MKERPILFSTPMVQAILKGEKTQTRRTRGLNRMNEAPDNWKLYVGDFYTDKKGRLNQKFVNKHGYSDHAICPYGQPGDLLYVRETWADASFGSTLCPEAVAFKADYSKEVIQQPINKGIWKPSIHMPKAAARIWLQVEEVQIERVQNISEEDAIAEGIEKYGPFGEYKGSVHPGGGSMRYRAYSQASRAFQDLWTDINGEESWKTNPWVWAVKFKVLSTTGKPDLTMNNSNLKTQTK